MKLVMILLACLASFWLGSAVTLLVMGWRYLRRQPEEIPADAEGFRVNVSASYAEQVKLASDERDRHLDTKVKI